jgi:queuine tRNA-ribosyltransferase
MLSPEKSIEIQNALGADIIMAFDECVPYSAERSYVEASVERTTRWLERCKSAHKDTERQSLFGIMQGGMYKDQRRKSAEQVTALGLPGYAIGGLSVGEPKELMYEILDDCVELLPVDKPRYLMGVGSPDALLEGVALGVDMFDCVFPTRNARNGSVLTRRGAFALKKAENRLDFFFFDEECGCKVCRSYSRSYLRHLFRTKEILCSILASYHNLYFLNEMVREAREAVRGNRFMAYKKDFLAKYSSGVSQEGVE